jgi:hypothetical protein
VFGSRGHPEFLTKRTTCPSILPRKTTSQIIYQKGPSLGGGRSCQATHGTCLHSRWRQVPAAWAHGYMSHGMSLAGGRTCRHGPRRQVPAATSLQVVLTRWVAARGIDWWPTREVGGWLTRKREPNKENCVLKRLVAVTPRRLGPSVGNFSSESIQAELRSSS